MYLPGEYMYLPGEYMYFTWGVYVFTWGVCDQSTGSPTEAAAWEMIHQV